MLNSKLIRSALSLILVLVLVFSLGAVNAFADEASETGVETEVVTDGATAAESETAAGDGHVRCPGPARRSPNPGSPGCSRC